MKNKKKRDYRRNNLLKVRKKDRLYRQRRRDQLKAQRKKEIIGVKAVR